MECQGEGIKQQPRDPGLGGGGGLGEEVGIFVGHENADRPFQLP